MTETCGIYTAAIGHNFIDLPYSCGAVMSTFALKSIEEAGTALSAGQVGEYTAREVVFIYRDAVTDCFLCRYYFELTDARKYQARLSFL